MQTLSEFYKRYLEDELVKGGHATDLYGSAGWALGPSPVLLFESKLYRSLLYESLLFESKLYLGPAVNRQPGYRRKDS